MSRILLLLAIAGLALAQPSSADLERARILYQKTEYKAVVDLLSPVSNKTAETYALLGQARFMSGEHKRAAEMFEKATALDPQNSRYVLWLGRAYGRQAESASVFSAPGLAVKARQAFEKAVALDPSNKDALSDLFEYYMDAPGMLGGGLNRAEQLIPEIARNDEAEGHFASAQLADKRKDFNSAEQQLRRAIDAAPRQVGRVLDLAKFLAKHDRVNESDQVFAQAAKIAPNSPQVLFDRAELYIKQKRNLSEAAELLEKYLKSPLTPDNAPREKALELLKQAKGG
jgi:tetratricopeptide (TPR) repeat protein